MTYRFPWDKPLASPINREAHRTVLAIVAGRQRDASRGKQFRQNALRISGLAALAVALASGCSQVLDLDQFNGAILDDPDSSQADARTGDDATQSDAGFADAPSGEGDDSAQGPDSYPTDAPFADASDAGRDSGDAMTLDGGAVDSPSPPDATDGATALEGSAPDASDAGDSGEAGGDWCAAKSTAATVLCRDFDDGKSYSYLFPLTDVNLLPGATEPSIISTLYDSPPNSLLFIVPSIRACSGDGGTGCSEQISLSASVFARTLVEVEFAIQFGNYDRNNVHDLSLARIQYNNGQWAANWALQLDSTSVFETIVPTDGGAPTAIQHLSTLQAASLAAMTGWMDVVFTVDVANQNVSLTLGGLSAINSAITAPPIQDNSVVTVGVDDVIGPTTPLSIFLDNVLVSTN
ncbi:MAG: hypothetical protein ABTD50_09215 [Polyangiaceae bacterium]